MKNTELQAALAEIADKAVPSVEIDLWQTIRRHLATSESRLKQGDASMKIDVSRMHLLRRATLILVAVIVGVVILFGTPQGRAFAQSILQFFIRTQGNTIPATPRSDEPAGQWVDIPGAAPATLTPLPALAVFTADCGDFSNPTCSMEQIRRKVDFPVKEPGSTPKGMYFAGATGGPDGILILYQEDAQNKNPAFESNRLSISEERWEGQPAPGSSEVAASAIVEKVEINGLPGEYYKGGFYRIGKDTVAGWNPALGAETVRWVDAGVSYTLKHSFGDGIYFGKKELLALAESMTTQSVTKLRPAPTPTPDLQGLRDIRDDYKLSLPEAEQQAGFKLASITRLPKFPPFIGAAYDPDRKIVKILYFFQANQASTSVLILNQQVAPVSDDCWLCGFFRGDDNHPVELDRFHRVAPSISNLQTVQMHDATGQYLEGFWYKPAQECCYRWEPGAGFKTLRWQENGVAYELYNMYVSMTKADMITIAKSIR